MAWTGGRFQGDSATAASPSTTPGPPSTPSSRTYGQPGREYGYAYFPDVVFRRKRYRHDTAIPFESMMLGYRNGENNLAFLGVWNGEAAGFGLGASLEFTVSGSKSPANAWHEYDWQPGQRHGVPERVAPGVEVPGHRRGDPETLGVRPVRGGVPGLRLQRAGVGRLSARGLRVPHTITPYDELQIWSPPTPDRFLFAATLGGRYRIKIK